MVSPPILKKTPYIGENLMCCCDIPADINEIKNEYEKYGYDFSLFD